MTDYSLTELFRPRSQAEHDWLDEVFDRVMEPIANPVEAMRVFSTLLDMDDQTQRRCAQLAVAFVIHASSLEDRLQRLRSAQPRANVVPLLPRPHGEGPAA